MKKLRKKKEVNTWIHLWTCPCNITSECMFFSFPTHSRKYDVARVKYKCKRIFCRLKFKQKAVITPIFLIYVHFKVQINSLTIGLSLDANSRANLFFYSITANHNILYQPTNALAYVHHLNVRVSSLRNIYACCLYKSNSNPLDTT